MEERHSLTAAKVFYYSAEGKKEEHFSTFQTPMLLFLGTSGWRRWAGQKEEDQSQVELQVGFRRNTDERSSLNGWRAHGSHQRHRTWGPTPPPRPPEPFPTQTNPATPKQNTTYRVESRRPGDARAALPPPPSAARSLRPPAGAPKRGRGAGARKYRDGNVKTLTNSS